MHVFKLGAVRVLMTKKGIEESQVHLKVKSRKTTLTASQFTDLHDWFEEQETRLVRKSLVWAKKWAPIFALGEVCAIKGEQLDASTFGMKRDLRQSCQPASAENRRPEGEDLECRLGVQAQKAYVGRGGQAEQEAQVKARRKRICRQGLPV